MERSRWLKTRGKFISLRYKTSSLYITLRAERLDNGPGYYLAKSRLLYEISRHDYPWALEIRRSLSPATSLNFFHALP
jgi:hypothetical protein